MIWNALIVLALVVQTPKAEMTRVSQFENDRTVSWKSVIPAHTESTLHRHDRYRTVIALVGGDLTLIGADGRKTVTQYETGKAYWSAPMPPGEMHKDANETARTTSTTPITAPAAIVVITPEVPRPSDTGRPSATTRVEPVLSEP